MKKAKVNILHVWTESGDHYYYKTKDKLNDEQIIALLREEYSEDEIGTDGPGICDSYFHAGYLEIMATDV